MAITPNDIKFFHSGSVETPYLGGNRLSEELADGEVHNLFSGIDPGETKYRCSYLVNAHENLTLQDAKIWLHSDDLGVDLMLAVEPLNQTAAELTDEVTMPSGRSFSTATKRSPLLLGDIPPGQHIALWIQLSAQADARISKDYSAVISVQGDSAG